MREFLFSLVIVAIALGLWWWEKAGEKPSPVPAPPEESPVVVEPTPLISLPEAPEDDGLPSIEDFFTQEFDGRDLRLIRVLEDNTRYTRYYITYRSGELTISGIMNIPKGAPPEGGFPVLLLNHGHIDTSIYTNGRGLKREQDYLAREGFAVLHSDYRNHAESSDIDEGEIENRLGYVEDVINAVYAVRSSDIPNLNREKIGMLGHSMGGGISQTVAVALPNLVQGIVLYAPVSMDYRDSYFRYMADNPERASRVRERFGMPEEYPERWDAISPATYADRIVTPMMLFHGTADKDVPISWSEKTVSLLKEKGKALEYVVYPNEGHEFGPRWNDFMRRSAEFFHETL